MNRAAALLTIPVLALALAGCGGGGSTPTAEPTDTAVPLPTPSETTVVPPADAGLAGDCSTADNDRPVIPVIYTVFTADSSAPLTVTYTSFNVDGTIPDTTETVTGPTWSKIGYACTDAAGSAIWTLTVTQTTTSPVACVLAFGGQLVKTDSQYAESADPTATTATCSGNPGM